MPNQAPSTEQTACHECDLLLDMPHPAPGEKALCPRCGYVLAQGYSNTVSRGLALCLAGLLLFYPAQSLPLLHINILGQKNTASVVDGVQVLIASEYFLIGALVFLCALAIPLAKLLLLGFCLLSTLSKRRQPVALQLFRWYHGIRHWGMLEIYLLGIVVSIVKLMDMAELQPGVGFFTFTGLMLISIFLEISMDEHTIWELLDKAPSA